jgi:UV DNA damage endonuclease
VPPSSRRSAGFRVSSTFACPAPGQFTVLDSENERTRRLAVEELEVQAEVMDAMRLGPEAVVIPHVGGVDAALERFEQRFELLSPAARARLAVENDDRCFGLVDVLPLERAEPGV